ncbi:RNA polymerase sigma factor [Streptomyces cadmiisoli]|uniref:RNA polymerase sigma factor 70 region 4 type 2 domain-containing protein n=1 Tax=Streptomyces cadmiisoli TaxID=2184053 RepID=A0A2Z4JE05_9ACTN|nr:sigma-70 family RNA polymerase sigma factor [Streptomyces cadmiisoli]AWW43349.1 hypothetical protein DN051_43045 [Streptomyces cadmiisoli]
MSRPRSGPAGRGRQVAVVLGVVAAIGAGGWFTGTPTQSAADAATVASQGTGRPSTPERGSLPEVAAPQDRYVRADPERTVRQALRRLPARQRAVVVLRYLEDRSVEETATLLNCTPETVRSQAANALRTLRGTLPNPVGPP